MDKFIRSFKVNKKVFVFLFGLMIIAVVFGSCLPLFLNSADRELVSSYLADFVSNIDNCDYIFLLRNGLINNGVFLFFIWILGISVIGLPIVLFLFFFKCFVFGFSISSIIICYGFKGVLFSFSYIFPHQVINVCMYGILTSYSLVFSIRLIGFLLKRFDFNIRGYFNRYFKVFLLCFLIVFVCTLYEVFVNPFVLKFVFKIVGI